MLALHSLQSTLRSVERGNRIAFIANWFRRAILSGDLGTDERLPATRKLARDINVARNTVVTVYEQLIAEGYAYSKQGAGIFVTGKLSESPTIGTFSQGGDTFPEDMTSETIEYHTVDHTIGIAPMDLFPIDIWARLNGRIWRMEGEALLRQSSPAGYLPLRQQIATYLQETRGVKARTESIVIVSGIMQGLGILSHVLKKDGNFAVGLEDPGYPGLWKTARALGHAIHPIPVDDEGMIVPVHPADLLVTSPSRQYPLTMTMSIRRRIELIEWADKHGAYIIEDDYDSEFRYRGQPIEAMQRHDNHERVIYAGSFSKTLFPGIRVGYLVLPQHLVDRFSAMRYALDSFPSIVPQAALFEFIREGHFNRHLRRVRKQLGLRAQAYQTQFDATLSPAFELIGAEAGLHMLIKPVTADAATDTLLQNMKIAGLPAMPIDRAYHSQKVAPAIMAGFTSMSPDVIASRFDHLSTLL